MKVYVLTVLKCDDTHIFEVTNVGLALTETESKGQMEHIARLYRADSRWTVAVDEPMRFGAYNGKGECIDLKIMEETL